MEETTNVENAGREAVVSTEKKVVNFDQLSNDTFLNPDVKVVNSEKHAEVVEKLEEKIETELKVESTEEKKEETKAEERPKITEEKPEEVLQVDDKEEVLQLEEKANEPEEGTWLAFAKEAGIEGVNEDSFDAVKEAIITPLRAELEALRIAKEEELFANVDPEIRMRYELSKSGMTLEQIDAPLKQIAEWKSLPASALYRSDLAARYPKANDEWLDAEVEKVLAIEGQLDHEVTRINMELDEVVEGINKERQQIVENYKANKDRFTEEKKAQNYNAFKKAMDEMPEFMGSKVGQESKDAMSAKFRDGKYDQILNDPSKLAKLIMYAELGDKAFNNAIAKSKSQAKFEAHKELSNVPPLDNLSGRQEVKETKKSGNFDKLENDAYLNGK